jgi:uncharacterized protein
MFKSKLLLASILMLAVVSSYSQEHLPLINSAILIQEGSKLHDEGKYREAIKVYDRITSADSNYVLALYEKALSCQADSQFQQGLKYAEEGLRLTSDREREPVLYTIYGSLLDDLNEYDRALRVFDSAIAVYPAHTPLYVNKVITLLNKKEYVKAEAVTRQALLQDPFSASLHYYHGYLSYQKGEIIPAVLSYTTYLLVLPGGKNSGRVINLLGMIARNENEVGELVAKRTSETPPNFQVLEQIIASKIALDKKYKRQTSLDDPICRQLQVMLEKLEYDENGRDFSMQYYVPMYRTIFADKQFEPFINYIFSNVNLDEIKSYNKKNKKQIQQFVNNTAAYLTMIRSTRELHAMKRKEVKQQYHFENNQLYGYGWMDGSTARGSWKFTFSSGNPKAVGEYNNNGQKHGLWKYYHFNGKPDGEENLNNGQLEGTASYYHTNGKPMLKGAFKGGKKQGEFIRYYKDGGINTVENYVDGMLAGTRKVYFKSGALNAVENYKNDKLNGPFTVYYVNGKKEKEGTMVDGKLYGSYNYYHENGVKDIECAYENGQSEGAWKTYHTNGKVKVLQAYRNDVLEGEYVEYHDNGQLFTRYAVKKGFASGEALYYDEDGKMFSTIYFDNGNVKWAKYYNKDGKQISSSEASNKGLLMAAYSPRGFKKSEAHYDAKGNAEGERTLFYPSGDIREKELFRNGELDGLSVGYYPGKNKRYEIAYQDGKKEGYYTSYYSHGAKKQEGWYQNDKAQGLWIDYYDEGVIRSKSEYLDDDQHGMTTAYWPNGKKQTETYFENGQMVSISQYDTLNKVINRIDLSAGTARIVYVGVTGKKESEGAYVNGEPSGEWKEYYFDGSISHVKRFNYGLLDSSYREFHFGGKPALEGKYKMGKKDGEWRYFKKAGTLYLKENYIDGELQGKRSYYYENGKVEIESNYKDDELHGTFTRFDENGTLMVQVNYIHGTAVSYTYLDRNNNLVAPIPLKDGNGKVAAFYPNGNKSVEFEIVDDLLVNEDNRYFATGKPWMQSTEMLGNTEGEVKVYYPDGTLRSSTFYLHNQNHGPFKEFHKNGRVKREGEEVRGMLHGKVKVYDENGKLTETWVYYFDNLLDVKK